ncbi:MAG: histidine-type phosphatase, partial [Mailhella sp.]|nr:histidine-type phosphatase [Mailhella sp.]
MRRSALYAAMAFFAAIAFGMPQPLHAETPPASDMESAQLVKAVILFRHGVRSPLQTREELNSWTQRQWPEWSVAPGELTPRGFGLLRAAGYGLREDLAEAGLLPATGCPPEGSLFAYADSTPRTRDSARALLEGLAPGCGFPISTREEEKGPAPLFHPVQSGLMPPPEFSEEKRLALEQDLTVLRSREADRLNLLAELLGPTVNQPDSFHFPGKSSRQTLTLEGGLKTASSCAEILFLESIEWAVHSQSIVVAERLPEHPGHLSPVERKTRQILGAPVFPSPASQARPRPHSWKPVPLSNQRLLMLNPATAEELLPVHTAVLNMIQRDPAIAYSSGLPLLALIAGTLAGTSPLDAANEAELIIFSGHDTNIANIAALLDLHWNNTPFPPDSIPP